MRSGGTAGGRGNLLQASGHSSGTSFNPLFSGDFGPVSPLGTTGGEMGGTQQTRSAASSSAGNTLTTGDRARMLNGGAARSMIPEGPDPDELMNDLGDSGQLLPPDNFSSPRQTARLKHKLASAAAAKSDPYDSVASKIDRSRRAELELLKSMTSKVAAEQRQTGAEETEAIFLREENAELRRQVLQCREIITQMRLEVENRVVGTNGAGNHDNADELENDFSMRQSEGQHSREPVQSSSASEANPASKTPPPGSSPSDQSQSQSARGGAPGGPAGVVQQPSGNTRGHQTTIRTRPGLRPKEHAIASTRLIQTLEQQLLEAKQETLNLAELLEQKEKEIVDLWVDLKRGEGERQKLHDERAVLMEQANKLRFALMRAGEPAGFDLLKLEKEMAQR